MNSAALPVRRSPHIVDVLIAERAPRLTASPVWPVVRPALYSVLNYRAAVRMADAIQNLSGAETLDHVSDLLSLKVSTAHLDRLPTSGRCVVVANHPTGIADGVAVYDAVRQRRPDAIFFANADALRVSPRLAETVIPVEWVHDKRTREKTRATLNAAKEAFEAERCVVMFPAGRLARKYGAPVIPMHVTGPYSRLFHLFDKVSQELRDVTLFHELLNKAGKPFSVVVGQPIPPERLDGDAVKATVALKQFTERTLAADPDAVFP